ncbi:MAG TPA: hypothetical protein PLO78_05745 [Candidatus Omnitrophota bacterium]|nr:hypothetical protein [Candidatus Omnitrophota bacterium]
MLKRLGKKHRGFTIIELVLVAFLSSFIILGSFAAFTVGNEQAQLSQTKMTLESSARDALYKMAQEIRQSAPSRITIAAGGASILFAVPDPANLITATYGVNWAGCHMIRYALGGVNNRQLIRTDVSANQSSVIANDITALQFAMGVSQIRVISITLSTQRTLISGRPVPDTPLQLTAQVEVRNT